jgi:hypothetical protein
VLVAEGASVRHVRTGGSASWWVRTYTYVRTRRSEYPIELAHVTFTKKYKFLIYINITSFFTFTKKYKFFNEYWTDKKLLYKMGMGGV